ncbi:stage II sporulation protein R [Cohnella yongneupensis]|uniref:Stage II sporulation protein R n=1 Tax=Cohnella yongneupensis TaxID=425006 RepID=A0ABW0R4A2_9BACL
MRVHFYPQSSSKSYYFVKIIVLSLALFLALIATFGRFASASASEIIPEDAIRIRIIANSDSDFDQKVKQAVRASVSEAILAWGEMPADHDKAQSLIRNHLKQLQKLVNAKLNDYDVDYKGRVELGEVPFPDKQFKGKSYAAGDYEALRITLGEGKGANWWCVLFPPMCLTAATAQDDDAKVATASVKPAHASNASDNGTEAEKPKPKFFLWVIIQKLIAFIAGLFS